MAHRADSRSTTTPPLGTAVPALFAIRPGRSSVWVALRTAIATVAPVVIGHWLGEPLWLWAALGAYTTALADVVDTYERQVRLSVVVTVGSALIAILGAVAGTWPIWTMVGLTFAVAFTGSAVRGLGRTVGTAGFFILIAYVASLGTPAGWHDAMLRGTYVFGGGVWASLLILTRWAKGADRPVFAAAAYPYERLAKLARLIARERSGNARAERETLREHRDVRDAVSLAHDTIARERPGATTMALHTVIDDSDHLFGVVLAFGEAVAAAPERVRGSLLHIAEELQRLCGILGVTIEHRAPVGETPLLHDALRRLTVAIDEARRELVGDAEYTQLLDALIQVAASTVQGIDQLGAIVQVNVPRHIFNVEDVTKERTAWVTQEYRLPESRRDSRSGRRTSVWMGRLRTVLDRYVTPESPVGRHALRVGLACAIAEAVAWLTKLGHGQWVALTVLVVLQPDLGTTFRRGAHRIAGTVVGGVIAAGLASALPSTVTIIFVLFPLLFVTVLLAPVHYALFSMFVTPTFVLFSETNPGDWRLAYTRVFNTCVGGALALIAARVLWPQSERTRVGSYLAAVLRAAARYVRVVAERRAPIGTEEWMTYRAAVGRANTAAEDSVLRWRGERVTSPAPVRGAALLVLNARGLAAVITWLAIIGDETAGVSSDFLLRVSASIEDLAVAMTEGQHPRPLVLPEHNHSVIEQRLCEWMRDIHAAAVRYARG